MILIPLFIVFIVIYVLVSVITFIVLIPLEMGRKLNDFFSDNIGKVNFVISLVLLYWFYISFKK